MTIESLLFSYRGRLNRAKYWLAALIYFLVIAIPALVLFGILRWNGVTSTEDFAERLNESGTATISLIVLVGIFVIIWLAIFVSSILVAIRRLHDRDKSGWWIVFFYVFPPVLSSVADVFRASSVALALILSLGGVVISLWALIELGFLRGTDGANRFGVDPVRASYY